MVELACAMRSFPTRVDPVNEIFLTSLCVERTEPTSWTCLSVVTTLNTPLGTPARSPSSANANAEYGVSAAGLRTTVHPAAIAPATFLVIMPLGKFHGVSTPTTPTGCWIVMTRLPGIVPVAVYPYDLSASPLNQSKNPAAYLISCRAPVMGRPFSYINIFASVS